MRLSDWRADAPNAAAVGPKVLAALEPVLTGLGADVDPPCWIAWGDDPGVRYSILALGQAGLALCHVRVNVPQEGPRASGKLVRWNRIQVGELAVENQGGHALVSFQVEGQLLRGVDEEGERVSEFALELLARIDGGPSPTPARRGDAAAPALPPGEGSR